MTSRFEIAGWRSYTIWGTLLLYVLARISQLYADRLPSLLIVLLHVIPPAVFAIVHGSVVYSRKGIAIFVALCLGFATLAESLSLRTGFPFGRYYFTDVMGPKIFQLPALLALAYLGIGYAAWIVALFILDYAGKPLRGARLFALPLLASVIMMAWDLSMDPYWGTLIHAWIWQDGGGYFGVPVSNFFGWFLTAFIYYFVFALYCGANSILTPPAKLSRFWLPAILLYAVCGLGNLLILRLPMAPPVVADAAGKQWSTADVLGACVLVSLLVMLPFALLAWLRLTERQAE